MSTVPDSVIEKAHGAADDAWTDAEPWRGPQAFARVIAGWATTAERQRIKDAVEELDGTYIERAPGRITRTQAYEFAIRDALLLIDGKDTPDEWHAHT